MNPIPALALTLTLLLFSACDDRNPTDQTPPQIALASSATTATVWNTVTLTATASDDRGIDKIELSIDGATVSTANTSPYQFSWDTQTTADGPHTVTATVTDKAGNQQTTQLDLTVQNILLEADVTDNVLSTYDGPKARGFIFLSDDQGKVIVAQEFKEGDHLALKAPGFNGSEFSVTEVNFTASDPYNPASLVTTMHTNRGKWVLNARYANYKTSAGKANLTFANADGDITNYFITANGNGGDGNVHPDATATVDLNISPSMLYVRHFVGQDIRYHVFPTIVTGANATPLDLSLVNTPFTTEDFDLPTDRPDAIIFLYGMRANADGAESYDLGSFTDVSGKISMIYPGDAFPAYHSVTYTYGADFTSGVHAHKRYDLTKLDASLHVSYANNKFTVAASGTMDAYNIIMSAQETYRWLIFADKGTTSLIIPEIPTILKDIVSFDRTALSYEYDALDYAPIDGYNGLLSFLRASKIGHEELNSVSMEYKLIIHFFNAACGCHSGRKKYERTPITQRKPYVPKR